jgi:NAD(P)-dependent dehydrogenase (short-subunit alcohol dehydrogenase family)
LTQKSIHLIAEKGKIVTLGSMAGKMSFNRITNNDLKERWQKKDINRDDIFNLMHEFEQGVAEGDYDKKGWPKSGYGISKLGINVYHSALARFPDIIQKGIQVYVCCPGYVNTDMTSHKGVLTIEEGIRTPVMLIELPFEVKEEWQGGFFQE